MANDSRDWMIHAYCRGKDPKHWESDNRGGGQETKARRACAPCKMHQQCAAYHIRDLKNCPPLGVVVAGVPIKESRDDDWHQQIEQLRQIARGNDELEPTDPLQG
ncbi:hypothetical protein SEA_BRUTONGASTER_103 [Gordonia phage BrutonGaster]|uniref:4Fe-4S Wbl-type domain-containing protein n=1 Tax=Gordonia phage BrutonGaster TaxID=2530116 RepID=A0A482JH93_9CAUD|nr:transcriptional regulator WhiB-like [Gordonia phage BrutonGaster]QBP33318.1 hypothetical protein SEA_BRUTONGASTER_103 [Gordonia phage BrutonGaster]